jgi:thiol-disulfide isomerase/thioredoxin
MSPTLVTLLRLALLLLVGHQLWTMAARSRARGYFLPRDAREWRLLGGDAITLLIGGYALLTLQRNYQEPMDRMASMEPKAIRSVRFLDARTGKTRSLSEWEGRWVILNIWGTWCPPCRREMPELDRVQSEAGPAGTAVIALSDEDPATVRAYLLENPMQLTVGTVTDMPEALAAVGTRPVSMLISPEGRVVDRVVGARGYGFFTSWAATGQENAK